MSQLTGKAYIDVPGFGRLRSKAGAKLNTGGFTRETKTSDSGVEGFTEEIAEPSIECTIIHEPTLSITDLNNIRNANITFQTDTGSSWVLMEAWLVDPTELSTGEVPVKFAGKRCEPLS